MAIKYSIGEFSKKTATTIRTLHYYDEIGLLKPSFVSEKGRRSYSDEDIVKLQRIVTLKFLGYSLEQIKDLFASKRWNLTESLTFQREVMHQKKHQIENVIKALDHALHIVKEDEHIDPSVFITLINNIQMEDEHKEWLKEYLNEERIEEMFDLTEEKQLELEKRFAEVSKELKSLFGEKPDNEKVQEQIEAYMDIANNLVGNVVDFVQEIEGQDIPEDKWLFHSPFSPEEEEWVAQALDVYLKSKGVDLNAKDIGENKKTT